MASYFVLDFEAAWSPPGEGRAWFALDFEADWAGDGEVPPQPPPTAPVVIQVRQNYYMDTAAPRRMTRHGESQPTDFERAGPIIRRR